MTDPRRAESLRDLLAARAGLVGAAAGGTDCVRLCAGLGDGQEGLLVDRFGALVVAIDYAGPAQGGLTASSLLRLVREAFPSSDQHVVAKARAAKGGTNAFETLSDGPSASVLPVVGTERGLQFEIGLDPAHDFGLFLDAAKARLHVRAAARGRRVLNLFSYAGAFGIVAAAGGAVDVANVDPNREYLTWSLRNAARNAVSMRVLPDTAQAHLAKHLRRLARNPAQPNYDLVIVDPPAFGVGRGNERVLRLLWPQLFEGLRTIRPATVVLMSNDKAFRSRQSFAELVEAELGAMFQFQRLGTHLAPAELDADRPTLLWQPGVEDPYYVEPVVLAGTARPPVVQ